MHVKTVWAGLGWVCWAAGPLGLGVPPRCSAVLCRLTLFPQNIRQPRPILRRADQISSAAAARKYLAAAAAQRGGAARRRRGLAGVVSSQ